MVKNPSADGEDAGPALAQEDSAHLRPPSPCHASPITEPVLCNRKKADHTPKLEKVVGSKEDPEQPK